MIPNFPFSSYRTCHSCLQQSFNLHPHSMMCGSHCQMGLLLEWQSKYTSIWQFYIQRGSTVTALHSNYNQFRRCLLHCWLPEEYSIPLVPECCTYKPHLRVLFSIASIQFTSKALLLHSTHLLQHHPLMSSQ